ncbi:MBL fold metallo-hydrolase [Kitasatospora griseola]|uniref:MBL fold metallo-hydrolase n=1 Tax=Kitasatospora griseola TaxID=2064 RepID=UPI003654AC43
MSRTKVVPIPVMGRHNINAYLLLGRRPVLVDAGTPGSGRKIHDGLAARGVNPADLALIVITHGHIDHFGSAAELHRLTGAPWPATSPTSGRTARAASASRTGPPVRWDA